MGKPLLTDDIIERARRGETICSSPLDNQDTKVINAIDARKEYGQNIMDIKVEPSVIKSRRIENEKRGLLKEKLNRMLFIIIVLLAILIFAVFRF